MPRIRMHPAAVAALVVLHPLVTRVAWRDIARRPAGQLRGPKTLWRVLTALNAGNTLIYLLVGVRRRS